jgi:hypothetical protein
MLRGPGFPNEATKASCEIGSKVFGGITVGDDK